MIKKTIIFICLIAQMSFLAPFAASEGIAKSNGINIWYETFGKKEDPTMMLIMGALGQGVLWPKEFCEQLAESGFYVIRYDHRDAGLSTCFDFEKNPYNLLDMAKDALGLLDYLKIEKAHLCGLSMGGPVAELMSVHSPERIASLTLMATSSDLRPCILTFESQPIPQDVTLSIPKDVYTQWMRKFLQSPSQTREEQLEERVSCWAILNGSIVPFEENRYREIHAEFLDRLKHPESLTNHMSAIRNSFDMIQEVPKQVQVPTLIIQGSEDPILPPDHGESLSSLIGNSRHLLVQGFGHVPNNHFYDLFIREMKHLTQQTE